LRAHPDAAPQNKAWLDDLAKSWTFSDTGKRLVAEARALLDQAGGTAQAIDKLEELERLYVAETITDQQRLSTLHEAAVLGTIAALVCAVALLVLLMFLTRRWLLNPLLELRERCLRLAAGQLTGPIKVPLTGELAGAGTALTQVAAALRESEERVSQAERLASIGEVCSHVTNNIRRALQSILNIAQHGARQEQADPESKVAFQSIITTANKLESWVRDLHVTASSRELQTAPQALEPLLHNVLSLLDPNMRERQARVELQPGEALPNVTLDRGLIEQALVAVLDNALDASPPGGSITMRTLTEGEECVVIQVDDQGSGLSAVAQQRAFDPFYTTKPQSAGLGLTMARQVIARHGGAITLGPGPQGGTRVTIKLPVERPVSPPTPTA
jgi:signal transduction histidine kinase